MTFPWRHAIATAAGVVVTAIPDRAGFDGPPADALHVLGPLVATVGLLAGSGVLRPLRWANVLLGALVVACAFVFDLAATEAAIVAIAAGTAAAVASATDSPDPRFRGRWRALLRGGP